MGFELSIEADEEEDDSAEPGKLTMKMMWLAQEGKADDLKSQFQKILDVLVELAGDDAPPEVNEMLNSFEFDVNDDTVSITFKIVPPPEEEDVEQEVMDSAFEGVKPKITASLWTGRTFPEMYENSEETILTLPHGMKGHADLSFN